MPSRTVRARVRPRRFTSALLLLLLLLLCRGSETQGAEVYRGENPAPLASSAESWKSLARFPDPVLVQGEWLPDLLGSPLGCLRLYAWRQGAFEPIRFQVDERTEGGDWVFPHGKKNNPHKGNGLLDSRDVLLFMARDSGDRAPGEAGLQDAAPLTAILLEDPVHGGRGWVYLARHTDSSLPRSGLRDYVRYNYDKEEVVTDCVAARFIITKDGRHTGFSESGGPVEKGESKALYRMDRFKFRVQIRFFFNLIPLSFHEEIMTQDVVAYISGPIRVIRRLEQFIQLPLGLKGMKSFTDIQHYESLAIVPIEIHVPKGVHRAISHSQSSFGVDYAPTAAGSLFRNSESPEPFVIDGRMSESEKLFCTRQDKWRIVYGPSGAMINRGLYPPEMASLVDVRQNYLDDYTVSLPPERYPGSVGYACTEVLTLKSKSGAYRILMDVYFPPDYCEGDEVAYLDVRDRPLKVRLQDREYANQLNPDGPVGQEFH